MDLDGPAASVAAASVAAAAAAAQPGCETHANDVWKVCSLHATRESRRAFKAIRHPAVFTLQMSKHLVTVGGAMEPPAVWMRSCARLHHLRPSVRLLLTRKKQLRLPPFHTHIWRLSSEAALSSAPTPSPTHHLSPQGERWRESAPHHRLSPPSSHRQLVNML